MNMFVGLLTRPCVESQANTCTCEHLLVDMCVAQMFTEKEEILCVAMCTLLMYYLSLR